MFKTTGASILRKILVLMILCTVASFPAVAFSDIQSSDDSAVAIEFLREHKIINGYPDGTFQPERALNRAELTKIVIESLDLKLIEFDECFPDVNEEDWFAKYVCTAKGLGWIQGYDDGTFKPEQTINHAEVMKIIALASEWELSNGETSFTDVDASQWYLNYVVAAEKFNFLPFSSKFEPAAEMTRQDFAEIYYRIVYTSEAGIDVFIAPELDADSEDTVEDNQEESLDLPEDIENIDVGETVEATGTTFDVDTFENLILKEPFPTSFLENEVYYFEGTLDQSADELYVVKFLKGDKSTTETFKFPLDSKSFSVPVYFKGSGDFYIGLAPKGQGEVVIAEVSVGLDNAESSELEVPSMISDFSIGFENGRTNLSFSSDQNLKKFILSQSNKKVEYFSRQTIGELALKYSDFEGFNEGEVKAKVMTASLNENMSERSAWSADVTISFSAVTHHYSEVEFDLSNLVLPDFFVVGEAIRISAKAGVETLSKTLSVIRPDGKVDEISLAANVSPGESFSFIYDKIDVGGVYFVEVNKTTGIAAINHPVYQSSDVPLIPDYFDLNPLKYSDDPFDELGDKALLLSLINQERAVYGLSQLSLNEDLSSLAKSHAQDMIQNDYFAHINQAGLSPNDRAIAAGFGMYIGENLANSTSTEYSHYALMRSAIHRDNILQSDWTRVGLGIAVTDAGQYYVVQEFASDSSYFYNELIDYVESSTDMIYKEDLAIRAKNWTDLMVSENFFDTSYGDRSVADELSGLPYSEYRILILSGLGLDKFKESLLEDKSWDNFGLNLAYDIDDGGIIKLTVLYSKD